MRSLQPVTSAMGGFFVRMWSSLWTHIPDRCKRMCVLASLYATLVGCTEDDTEQLEQVNEKLGLSRDTQALKLPTVLAPYIWPKLTPDRRLDKSRADSYIRLLMQRCPCWLRYGDENTMKEDLKALVELTRSVKQ